MTSSERRPEHEFFERLHRLYVRRGSLPLAWPVHPDFVWEGTPWDRANEKRLEAEVTMKLCWHLWPGFAEVKAAELGGDPPDCVVRLRDGGVVGVEVCRLVDQEVLEQNLSKPAREGRERDMREAAKSGRPADLFLAHGRHHLYRFWSRDLLIGRLRALIADKDRKEFSILGNLVATATSDLPLEYSERWLLIPTNEIDLCEKQVRVWLAQPEPVGFVAQQFDRAFIIFPWGPTGVRASVSGAIPEVVPSASFVGPIVELKLIEPDLRPRSTGRNERESQHGVEGEEIEQ